MATFTGTSGNDTLTGGDGDDSIDGLAGDDSINGGDGGDTLIGGLGNDSLFGGAGADAFIADAGNDTLDGGAVLVNFPRLESNKGIYTNSPAAVTVNLATGSAQDGWGGTDTLRNINFVFGSSFADQLTGGTAMIPELFSGGLGNDTIDGGLITSSGVSVASGNGSFGNSNFVFYTDSPAAVQVDLGLGSATGGGGNDRLININVVFGSEFADKLKGSNSTTLVEVFSGEAGNDTIDGGLGLDSATYVTASGAANVNLTTGVASDGLGGTDTLLNIEAVFGSKYGDTLTGNSESNLLWGDLGNDTLSGGAGNDTLKGEQGNDAIDGGNGWDQAVFSGNLSDYSVAFNPSLQTVTIADNRIGNAANSGTDVLKNIDNFQFADTSKTLLGLVNALGQNYGVDLNGLSDGGLQRTYWMGPNQYYPGSNNVLQKQAGAGFWGAEVGLSGGVKAVRISTDQSASSIQKNAILDWTFGNYSGQTNPTTMRFADSTASAVSFTSNSKTFTATPSTHVTSGVTYYDLLIKASDGGLVDSEAVTNALTQINLDYRSNVTQPAQEQFDVKLQVNISADLQSWVGASTGQTDTFIARMDNQGPLVAVANYSGRMVGLGFKNILGMGTGLPDASKDAWQAHPDKSYFNVTVDGKQVIVMDAVMVNDGVALLLGSAIPSTAREVMVSYTDPTGNQSTKVIEDWQGNDTPSFTIQALRNDALDFVGTIHSNAVLGYDTDGNSAAKYVSDDDDGVNEQTLAEVTSVNGTSATLTLTSPAWGRNPGYVPDYTYVMPHKVTQFEYTKEKFDFTVVNPNGNTYALGSTVSLQDLINFNNGVKFTLFTAYVMASNSNTATDGTSFELARYSTSAPFPMWGLVTGFALGEGNFTINGGPGDDAITVNGPNGVAYGGAGNDTYWYAPIGNGEKYTIDDASGSADTLSAQLFDGFDMILQGERIGNDLQFVGSASNMANANSTLYIKNQYTTGTIENFNLVDPQGDTQQTYKFVVADTGDDANNLMAGNSQANVLSGGAGDDMIFGGGGNDTLTGGDGNDTINGGAGDDTLIGGLGNDSLFGGTGSDLFIGDTGSDTLDGGAVLDLLLLSDLNKVSYTNSPAAVTVSLATGSAQDGWGGTDTLRNINFVFGSNFADQLTGGTAMIGEIFTGGLGNDTIDGGLITGSGFSAANGIRNAGNSNIAFYTDATAAVQVDLGLGSATGGGGNDRLININGVYGSGFSDSLRGSSSTTLVEVFSGQAGNDTIDGGSGPDIADYGNASSAVNVNLTTGVASDGLGGTDTLSNIEVVFGSKNGDTLTGNSENNSLWGDLGNDTLSGGAGDDTLNGGEQRNLTWKYGQVFATSDFDTADYSNVTIGGIRLDLSTMKVTGVNGADVGTDTLRGIEAVRGTNQSDTVVGNLTILSGNNEAAGDQHGVNFVGYGGSDTITLTKVQSMNWLDSPYVGYWWSKTGVSAVFTGSVGAISYTASGTQAAGADTTDGVSGFGDSPYADRFDFSGMTSNWSVGRRFNYVNLNEGGNDTIVGNGDTRVHFSDNTLLSTTGLGINVRLAAPGTSFTVDMTHLSRSASWSFGIVTLSNIEEIRGTNLNDTLVGGAYDDYESFRGRGGDDFIDGGTGEDRSDYWFSTAGITANLAAGTVSGDSSVGTDALRSIERILGTAFDDVYDARGFSGASINAGSLGEWNGFEGRGGNDTIYGNGKTRIEYAASGVAVEVNLASGKAWALNLADRTGDLNQYVGTDTFTGVFGVRGSALGDLLLGGGVGWMSGDTAVEVFDPDAGNDTVNGFGGLDQVRYGSSTAAITVDLRLATGQVQDGMGGVDTLIGIEGVGGSDFNDSMVGSDTNNTGFGNQEAFRGGKGNDTLNGGGGYDEADYTDDPTNGVVVNLATGVAQDGWGGTDTLSNIEGVEGSWKDDSITGSSADNRLDGRAGNDTLDGGAGTDTAEYNQATGAVQVNLALGTATGADGNDTLISIEGVQGSVYGDTLTGNAGANTLQGLAGNDTLSGAAGNDTLDGGLGMDRAVFSGKYANYTVTTSGNSTTVKDNLGTDGTDTLINTEELTFSDKTVLVAGGLRGIAYDWKNHMLLKDVTVAVTSGGAPVDAPIQFKGLTVDASGRATLEVWSHSTKAFENAGFEIEIPKATSITFTAGALPANATGVSGWTVIVNAEASKLSMAGFATDASYAVSAGDFKLGTLTFEIGTAQGGDLYLVGGDVGGAKASAYGVSAARTSTSVSGEFSFSALQSGTYDLSANRATTDIGSAVTSADALAALKLAVGINPNADPDGTGPQSALVVSPYQFMAADVTGTDGRVTSADALAILKMAVKLPTAPTKEWMFVEESRDFWNEATSKFTLDRNNASWDHSISGVKVPGEANLVGVLKGDVNGSWTAPTDSLDLDTLVPTHFTALSSVFGMPVAQFGIV